MRPASFQPAPSPRLAVLRHSCVSAAHRTRIPDLTAREHSETRTPSALPTPWACALRAKTVLLPLAALILCTACSSTSEEEQLLQEIRESTIVPQLGSFDPDEQGRAIQIVQDALRRAPEGTAEILAAAFRDPLTEDRTKLVAAWLLSHVRDQRALPVLVDNLKVNNETARDMVRSALLEYGSRAVPAISHVLDTGDDASRELAASILIDIGGSEASDRLWTRYDTEPNTQLRFLIVCGVASDPRPQAVDRLLQALVDRDSEVREIGWSALSHRAEIPAELPFQPDAPADVRTSQVQRIAQWVRSRR